MLSSEGSILLIATRLLLSLIHICPAALKKVYPFTTVPPFTWITWPET